MFLRSEMGVKAIILLRPEKFFKNYHTLFYNCLKKLSLGPIPLFRRFPLCNTRYPSTFASKTRDILLVIYPIGHLLISFSALLQRKNKNKNLNRSSVSETETPPKKRHDFWLTRLATKRSCCFRKPGRHKNKRKQLEQQRLLFAHSHDYLA